MPCPWRNCSANAHDEYAVLRVAASSQCGSSRWMRWVSVPANETPTLVNVGANKGWAVVDFLEGVAGHRLNRSEWFRRLQRAGCQVSCCGVCHSCSDRTRVRMAQTALHGGREVPVSNGTGRRVLAHALELLPANAAMLRDVFASSLVPSLHGDFHVHNVAAAEADGDAFIEHNGDWDRAGTERHGARIVLGAQKATSVGNRGRKVKAGGGRKVHSVRAVSIDSMLSQWSLGRVHVLTVDAEGSDPAILAGAARALAARAIDVVEWEYHPHTAHSAFCDVRHSRGKLSEGASCGPKLSVHAPPVGTCGQMDRCAVENVVVALDGRRCCTACTLRKPDSRCKFTLSRTLSWLEGHGYQCFWAGATGRPAKSRLALASASPAGACWHAALEGTRGAFKKSWGNLVCSHREDMLQKMRAWEAAWPLPPASQRQSRARGANVSARMDACGEE